MCHLRFKTCGYTNDRTNAANDACFHLAQAGQEASGVAQHESRKIEVAGKQERTCWTG